MTNENTTPETPDEGHAAEPNREGGVPRKPSGERDWDQWKENVVHADETGADESDRSGDENPTGPADRSAAGADLSGPTGPGMVDPPEIFEKRTGAPERKAIMPAWVKSRSALARESQRTGVLALHQLGYHAVRSPWYAAKVGLYAPRGAFRLVSAWGRWCFDEEGRPLRSATAAKDDYEAYRKLVLVRDRHVRWRGIVSAVVGGAGGFGVLVAIGAGGPWAWGLGALAAATFGWAGKPVDRPFISRAVVRPQLVRPTSEVVVRALGSLGIGQMNQALAKNPNAIGWPSEITRDETGAGWWVTVDLPYGVTATEVCERRDKLASALTQPLGCVWPEGRPKVHPRRLVIYIGDQDMASTKQPAWPHAKAPKGVNLFEPVQIGTDPRGRAVCVTLMYANMVIGAIPRMGKTFALRLLLLAAALDVRCAVYAFDLKGTGDFKPLASIAHAYRAGDEEEDIEYVMDVLRELHKEMRRRTKVIGALPADVCPENKVTDALASKQSLGLHPIVAGIDECQRLYEHPKFGKEAEGICEDLTKRGPATGIVLANATQRIDDKSLPKSISSNAVLRLCLKVTGHIENDMVLGTSMYKAGVRATEFTFEDKGIAYLVGEGDAPTVVKNHFIDGPAAEKIAARARAMREATGRLTGYAAGETVQVDRKTAFDLLKDLLAVWPRGRKSVWNAELVDALAELRPETYGDLAALDEEHKTAALTHRLRECGAHELVKQIGRRDKTGKTVNRRGLDHTAIRNFVTERDGKTGA